MDEGKYKPKVYSVTRNGDKIAVGIGLTGLKSQPHETWNPTKLEALDLIAKLAMMLQYIERTGRGGKDG